MLNGQYKVKTRSVKSAAGTDVTGEPWRNGTSAPAYKMCGTSRSSLAPRKQSPGDNASACVPTRSQPVSTACKSDTESVQTVAFRRKMKNGRVKKKENHSKHTIFICLSAPRLRGEQPDCFASADVKKNHFVLFNFFFLFCRKRKTIRDGIL